MFENQSKNQKMIIGAYKKLKSHFYYDKSILFNKIRLSTWEASEEEMKKRMDDLAVFLTALETRPDENYMNFLMKGVRLVPLPKAFADKEISDHLLQNVLSADRNLEKVNFYIKAPVELLILDTIWALMTAKIASEQNVLGIGAYANKLKRQIFYENPDLIDGIDFHSNRLFVPYFKQYTGWRNNAFTVVKNRYENEKDSVMIALDIKSYFYSVAFRFDELDELLHHDARLSQLRPLTRVIEAVYISYTAEMKKYRRDIRADCGWKETVFPIGLFSGMVLSNMYLHRLDAAVEERIHPSYYGRYVDDILIVADRTPQMEISVSGILKEVLVNNGIIQPCGEGVYQTISPPDLELQQDKVRCIYFDHNEPSAMIKLLCEAGKTAPSGVDLMPDINVSQRNFDEIAYTLGQQAGTLKVRSFLFSTNNFAAILFVNDLIRSCKNVDVGEIRHHKYMEEQIRQILNFYSGTQAVEYRSAWSNVFTLILLNKRYDYFCNFYCQIRNTVQRMKASQLDMIETGKTGLVLARVKEALLEQLDLSASISLAPMALEAVASEINRMLLHQHLDICLEHVFQDAWNIRRANMFNNYSLSFPLINYISGQDDANTALNEVSPKDIAGMYGNLDVLLPLDPVKILWSPRFIYLDELFLLNFLVKFKDGGNPCSGDIEPILQKFYEINCLSSVDEEIAVREEIDTTDGDLKLQSVYIPPVSESDVFSKPKIAIASVHLDENSNIIPTITKPQDNLSFGKKNELYKMLNNAIENHADMIVFPEFFMPVDWLEEVYTFARRNSIAIISGLRYIVYGNQAYNYLIVIQPFSSKSGFKYSLPLIREKNHYAPAERSMLKKYHLICKDPDSPYTHLISWKNMNYSDMMCYELTNISYRYKLCSRIELLIVPELNPDTDYFSNIVEATSRDLHCFVVQVNSSKYGDSRITGPFNSMFKDVVKIKGGENNVLLLGTIELENLLHNRFAQYESSMKSQPKERRMKAPPAGFHKERWDGGE